MSTTHRERGLVRRLVHGLVQPSDESLTVLLVWLASLLFIASPLLPTHGLGAYLVNALFSFVLITSAFALPPRLRVVSGVVAVLTIVTGWLTYVVSAPILFGANALLTISFLVLATVGILARVFAPGPVTQFRIHGAIVVYLLTGLTFGLVFACLFMLDHQAFDVPVRDWEGTLRQQYDMLLGRFTYFSFATLTTVGYGDITPVSPAARQLAVLLGLVGQLYPAVLLARLVSMELSQRSVGND